MVSISLKAQPKNIQCRVFEIVNQERNKIECTALSMRGDTIHLRFGWKGFGSKYSVIKIGTWITVYADYSDKQCEWICRKIKVNK